jgi:hypothetical protein
VFTARYALSPYRKWITFRLWRVNSLFWFNSGTEHGPARLSSGAHGNTGILQRHDVCEWSEAELWLHTFLTLTQDKYELPVSCPESLWPWENTPCAYCIGDGVGRKACLYTLEEHRDWTPATDTAVHSLFRQLSWLPFRATHWIRSYNSCKTTFFSLWIGLVHYRCINPLGRSVLEMWTVEV